jgi:hypothetical protein
MLQVCLSRYCICFTYILQVSIYMLHMFCNDFQLFFRCVLQVSQTHFSSVASVLRRTLQALHLDVLKVDWVFHMLQCDPPAATPAVVGALLWVTVRTSETGRRLHSAHP